MLDIDHERRSSVRRPLVRPCKVFEPRGHRYISGCTRNVSPGGMLIALDRCLPLEIGDRLYVGTASSRRQALLRADDMVEARVVRVLSHEGETILAVQFAHAVESAVEQWSSRRAA
jgi:c-di-GMP-binding flagellar brake protein YcgR